VSRIAVLDGGVLVFIAGGFALLSASQRDWLGAGVGGLAAGAGLLELHGRQRLRAGEMRGVRWLVRSQLVLLAVILLYVAYQFCFFDPGPLLAKSEAALASTERSLDLDAISFANLLGVPRNQLVPLAKHAARVAYVVIGLGSILCQGGLAFYYHRRERPIAAALRKI
jgi:hypothetical protein